MQTLNTSKPRPLSREEASRHLRDTFGIKCKVATLAKLATVGGGPKFRKAGRYPIYSVEDLDAWAEARLSAKVGSTSELGKGRAA